MFNVHAVPYFNPIFKTSSFCIYITIKTLTLLMLLFFYSAQRFLFLNFSEMFSISIHLVPKIGQLVKHSAFKKGDLGSYNCWLGQIENSVADSSLPVRIFFKSSSVLTRRNDAEMSPVNSLHAPA